MRNEVTIILTGLHADIGCETNFEQARFWELLTGDNFAVRFEILNDYQKASQAVRSTVLEILIEYGI